MLDPTQMQQVRAAQSAAEASIAIAFSAQAIAILNIKEDFARKDELQNAAATHLLAVFQPLARAPLAGNGPIGG